MNEEICQQGLEQVSACPWFFVGYDGQVPQPGDPFQSRMRTEAVRDPMRRFELR